MSKFLALILLMAALVLAVGSSNCPLKKKKLNKKIKQYRKRCLNKGFQSSVGCTSVNRKLGKKTLKKCQKIEKVLKKCDFSCPVDGGWSDYGVWTDCSADCGGGKQTRSRTCTKPVPNYGGRGCSGNSVESQRCNTQLCPKWSAISNATSETFNLDPTDPLQFKVKFTQHKEINRSLYLSTSVHLYNADGIELGQTNFVFYIGKRGDKVSIRGSQRFYFAGPWGGTRSCQTGTDLSDLGGFDFVMTTAVGSSDMFQFETSSGQTIIRVEMGGCDTYPEWQEMIGEAVSAELSLYTWQEYLNDYFTTQFTVV